MGLRIRRPLSGESPNGLQTPLQTNCFFVVQQGLSGRVLTGGRPCAIREGLIRGSPDNFY